jgi:hypothetical protein
MREQSGTGVTLDERRLNLLLRYGNKLAVTRDAERRVVHCAVSGLGEVVPLEMFEGYLAHRWIEDVARGERFGISEEGRRRLR